MIDALCTPDSRFTALPGFDYVPNYRDDLGSGFEGLRMHYVDAGPRDAATTFLCVHGQPTWSYLYRHMIPPFVAAGHRVVAPDFFGFGRSDKPHEEAVYTFTWHRESLRRFVECLDLRHVVLVCQDWGGLLALTLPHEMPGRFDRLLVMNTMLGTGDVTLPQGFLDWRAFCNSRPDLIVGTLMQRACPHLSDA